MILTIVTILSAIVGLTGLFVLKPRVDIAPLPGYERIDNPTHAGLSVTNNGVLSIYPNKLSCWMSHLETEKQQKIENGKLNYTRKEESELKGGESVDFVPQPLITFNAPVTQVDFLLIVVYRPQWWAWSLQKRVKYSVRRNADGTQRWLREFLTKEDREKEFPSAN